jgi:hypothetical protein
VSDQHRLQSVSVDELAISNMLKLNALVELLDEKGLLGPRGSGAREATHSVIRAPWSAMGVMQDALRTVRARASPWAACELTRQCPRRCSRP